MKTLLMLAMMAMLCGCVGATTATKMPDGKECTATYVSLFVDKESAAISACGSKGTTAGSRTNTELLQAIVKYMMAAP